eukprot:COSAG01_NODE_3664_length_5814_cov_15.571829_6_plen_65_part_00
MVAALRTELAAWGSSQLTCEEAETCGEPDPRALAAFEAAGYYVPWLFPEEGVAAAAAAAAAAAV